MRSWSPWLMPFRPPPNQSRLSMAQSFAPLMKIETARDIHAVIICTPTDTHDDLIEKFARAGKAIFCEKPVDLGHSSRQSVHRRRQGDRRKADGWLQPPLRSPFHGGQAGDRRDGRIGKVEMITITSRDPGPPPLDYISRSGGIFRDMTITTSTWRASSGW